MNKALWAVAALFLLNGCAFFGPTPAPVPSDKLRLAPVSFDALPEWRQDRQAEAIPALLKSCNVLLKRGPAAAVGNFGRVSDWRDACSALLANPPRTDTAARDFFESRFRPYRALGPGLFTGYYEATLNGSWKKEGQYATPLWQRPRDLLAADLGDFKEELKGKKILGKAEGQRFVPYDDRAKVSKGALQGRAEPLLWTDDPITSFFLEIQGSGRVKMTDGSLIRIGYDAQNGHPFIPIGRVLADEGLVEKPVTMKKIRDWLTRNPSRAQAMMNRNPSVVFFHRVEADGAVGAQGVPLTPMRSLAVDPAFVPLGMPLWLAMENRSAGGAPRLVVAQDTGGAIKGPVRGDFFCGAGEDAEHFAGALQSAGTYYLLLPKNLSVKESDE